MLHPGTHYDQWLITEVVFSEGNRLQGVIHSEQHLESANEQVLRSMAYTPSPELLTHPLGAIHGSFTFRAEREARIWQYTSHDLIGTAMERGSHLVTLQGLMLRLGYRVASATFKLSDERYVGFTTYSSASDPIAYSLSIAVGGLQTPPSFVGASWAGALSQRWVGTRQIMTPDGALQSEQPAKRRITGLRVEDSLVETGERSLMYELETWAPDALVSGGVTGIAGMKGHLLTFRAVKGAHIMLEACEVLDGQSETLACLRRWFTDQQHTHDEVLILKPA